MSGGSVFSSQEGDHFLRELEELRKKGEVERVELERRREEKERVERDRREEEMKQRKVESEERVKQEK